MEIIIFFLTFFDDNDIAMNDIKLISNDFYLLLFFIFYSARSAPVIKSLFYDKCHYTY